MDQNHRATLPQPEEKDACGVGFIYRPIASNQVIDEALRALACVEHRGACGADQVSGDGAGILTSIPWQFFQSLGWQLAPNQAVGFVFLPVHGDPECRAVTESKFHEEGMEILVWRDVPTRMEVLGARAKFSCPHVVQFLVQAPTDWTQDQIEERISIVRRRLLQHTQKNAHWDNYSIVSLSTRTIVYKALAQGAQLKDFYPDLVHPKFTANWAVFHRRFSTNTMPRWALAQPFRLLGHNGEINSLLGNRNWMKAREPNQGKAIDSAAAGNGNGGEHCVLLENHNLSIIEEDPLPIIDMTASDSANLDDALEMYIRSGYTVNEALMLLMPEPYRDHPLARKYPQIADFYEYHAAMQEPWDGPALIVYSDGKTLGAAKDRNGLRPCRYTLMKDGSVFLCSETGALEIPIDQVVKRGRLGPGQIISVDLETGNLLMNRDIKVAAADLHPYRQWLEASRRSLSAHNYSETLSLDGPTLTKRQNSFGFGKEDLESVVAQMAETSHEPIFCMGDDAPPAVLSKQSRVLYDYFKQRFAQVTNPPIDHLRERVIMSLDVYLGSRAALLKSEYPGGKILHLLTPVLNETELEELMKLGELPSVRLSTLFSPTANASGSDDATNRNLDAAVTSLCRQAADAVRQGAQIILLSDRGSDDQNAAIPPLMAVGAVHHHLIKEGLRLSCSLVLETGQCWSTHHYACLLGYGAQAICPYLAFETVKHWLTDARKGSERALTGAEQAKQDRIAELTVTGVQANYRHAVEEGILKILSKMGISALSSYIGAQVFECIGLGNAVVERCFKGTVSRVGGLEIGEIEAETLSLHARGCGDERIRNYGFMQHRPDGEFHGNNPQVVRALHKAIGLRNGLPIAASEHENLDKQAAFAEYSSLVQDRPPAALRDLLAFASDHEPISVDEVEPATEIVKRFCTGGMSLGALSKEAHEIMAIAMNRLGGKSNSGEGGEDPLRYYPMEDVTEDGTSPSFPGLKHLRNGDNAASAIRQVASARFGVTPEYLVTSKQLEIKMAQGSKPGEGGQLPAHKVSEYIARLRRAKQGITLISPPPHHDIYSIEDLAQLIYDLHHVAPKAKVSVKLVSEIGIGTIATGVVKANADIVQISGHDGGTGASPLSSIKNAGLPWELGLAEVQQALLANELRGRVLLRVDGGLRTGWDVVTAALLGADEYGFGSIALVAAGCIMARICHTNNCPVGITSQKEQLRQRFASTPEPVIEFFLMIADEVRRTLAQLGYRSLTEVIGRTDLLKARENVKLAKVEKLDLQCLLSTPFCKVDDTPACPPEFPHENPHGLDEELLADEEIQRAIGDHGTVHKECSIFNTDRAVGARMCGAIATWYGDYGFKGNINVVFTGTAGQSFGAFNLKNVNLTLIGEANDYVGKSMNGGEIVIKQPDAANYASHENVIIGNTCLYGATGGALYAAGQAGERFAVRNSQAIAVIEGAGDHCCEYMTGGVVVVLGEVGRNFGAGMTGGIAYVLDEENTFQQLWNDDSEKRLQRLPRGGERALKELIQRHHAKTGSGRSAEILASWEYFMPLFWQVVPPAEEGDPQVVDTLPESETVILFADFNPAEIL